ncbi:hypothetical protein O7614_26860 [Micromonospora sp. WMMD961]|uniref:hypothetical protein n=1 Tax=Micromonospora sp. WMMD961 TaxID=3016100 RepID=UPI002416A8F7|nr:hypothetical protein [Micromonospora sp. WMMD961]MDG4783284.1 hypothetical protein [Micromonospora sp. WMMD961]
MKPQCVVTNSKGEQCVNEGKGGLGLCSTHLYRFKRYNDVMADVPIRKYTLTKPRSAAQYDGDTELDRIWARVRKTEEHWIWTGSFARGVPQAQHEGWNKPVRRVFWELANGPLAEGERVTVNCGEDACVRLSHIVVKQPAVIA